MEYNLSNTSKARMEGIHPFLIEVLKRGIKNSPEDFGIPRHGGLRTSRDQQDLYAIGRTVDIGRKPVTFVDGIEKESKHQIKKSGYGEAFDFFVYNHNTGKASWNVEKLESVARHLQEVSEEVKKDHPEWSDLTLEWGGDWKRFKDRPHMQIVRA